MASTSWRSTDAFTVRFCLMKQSGIASRSDSRRMWRSGRLDSMCPSWPARRRFAVPISVRRQPRSSNRRSPTLDAMRQTTPKGTPIMRLRFEHGRADDLKTLHPAYFALVMATGIVSIATYLHGVPVLPTVLFWLNALFLAGLAAATGARILCYPRAFAADIQNHSRGVGFFTTVAAVAMFGTELVLLMDAADVAAVFWIVVFLGHRHVVDPHAAG